MKTNYNPQNNSNVISLDDIIFDGRNHAYGAYALRKNHHKYTNISFLFATSIAIAILIGTLINRHPEITVVPPAPPDPTFDFTKQAIELPKQPAHVNVGQAAINQARATIPIIVTDLPKDNTDNQPMLIDDPIDPNLSTGGVNGGIPGGTGETIPAIIPTDDTDPPANIQEPATFNGDFRQWVGKHLNYPSEPAAMGVEGRVIVQFVVNRKGKVEGVKVLRGIHPDLDKEAIRVISSSPLWTPGKQNGNPSKQLFTMAFMFKLSNN